MTTVNVLKMAISVIAQLIMAIITGRIGLDVDENTAGVDDDTNAAV